MTDEEKLFMAIDKPMQEYREALASLTESGERMLTGLHALIEQCAALRQLASAQ